VNSPNSATLAQGLHGSGSRDFDWREQRKVVDAVLRAQRSAPLTVEDLVARTDIPGRTVRAVLSAVDGVEFLLGGTGGYFVCEYADDGDSLSAALRSQITAMTIRLERRDGMALLLPRRQGRLL
jgi:hypothetical protein